MDLPRHGPPLTGDAPRPRARRRTIAVAILAAYIVALAVIAFWPEHVDRDLSGFFADVQRLVPWATYPRIEFASNVALFVPFGALLSIVFERRRYAVLPAAIVATVFIEGAQSLLPDRTPSVLDIVANVTGACIGIVLVAVFTRLPDAGAARR